MYCKLVYYLYNQIMTIRINSSKVYCKYLLPTKLFFFIKVLIVAKCIVNSQFTLSFATNFKVLIVAKCIVNFSKKVKGYFYYLVLIVAKCIVNL